MKKVIILGMLLSPVLLLAKGASYSTSDGERFNAVISKNQAVLTSTKIQTYNLNGKTSKRGKLQLTLTSDCKAKSNLLGNGNWHGAHGGVFIELNNKGNFTEITFPKQALSLGKINKCFDH